MNDVAQAAGQKESEFAQRARRLEVELGVLSDVVLKMSERLKPVLRPYIATDPEKKSGDVARKAVSPVVDYLERCEDAIRAQRRAFEQLIERLEV